MEPAPGQPLKNNTWAVAGGVGFGFGELFLLHDAAKKTIEIAQNDNKVFFIIDCLVYCCKRNANITFF